MVIHRFKADTSSRLGVLLVCSARGAPAKFFGARAPIVVGCSAPSRVAEPSWPARVGRFFLRWACRCFFRGMTDAREAKGGGVPTAF